MTAPPLYTDRRHRATPDVPGFAVGAWRALATVGRPVLFLYQGDAEHWRADPAGFAAWLRGQVADSGARHVVIDAEHGDWCVMYAPADGHPGFAADPARIAAAFGLHLAFNAAVRAVAPDVRIAHWGLTTPEGYARGTEPVDPAYDALVARLWAASDYGLVVGYDYSPDPAVEPPDRWAQWAAYDAARAPADRPRWLVLSPRYGGDGNAPAVPAPVLRSHLADAAGMGFDAVCVWPAPGSMEQAGGPDTFNLFAEYAAMPDAADSADKALAEFITHTNTDLATLTDARQTVEARAAKAEALAAEFAGQGRRLRAALDAPAADTVAG